MGRVFATATGVLVLALLAAGLTETTLAVGARGRLTDDSTVKMAPRPSASPSAKPSPSPSVAASPSASLVATPLPTPAPTPAGPTATTNSFVHMRAAATTSSAILYNLNGGTVVKLLPWQDSTWQEVEYNGATGYIYRSYLAY